MAYSRTSPEHIAAALEKRFDSGEVEIQSDGKPKVILTREGMILSEYLEEARATRPLSDTRVRTMLDIITAWRGIFKKPLHKLNLRDVHDAINKTREKGMSENTRSSYVLDLKLFLDWAVKRKYLKIASEDITAIKLPKPKKQNFVASDILTENEIKTVLEQCPTVRDRAFIATMYDAGFRAKELCLMRWKEMKFDIPEAVTAQTDVKTGEPRTYCMIMARPYLMQWREEYTRYGTPEGDNFVFVTQDGSPWTYDTAHSLIKRLREKTGLGKRLALHQFRRASITHEADRGRPVSHICTEKWGRSYSRMFERYVLPGKEQMIDSKLEVGGVVRRKYERRKGAMMPVQCPGCGTVCAPTRHFCQTCSRALTEQAIQSREEALAEIREDPKYRAWLAAAREDLKKPLDTT